MSQEAQISQSVVAILEAIGEDPAREGLRDTPKRVAHLYQEIFAGIGLDPVEALTITFDEKPDGGTIILRDLSFYSMCEHHLLPFYGMAHIGYIPTNRICGVSKLARALDLVAKRPQLQERMTSQLADAVYRGLDADGVAVVIDAEHLCMTMRGVRKPGSRIVTTAIRGPFANGEIGSRDFLSMLQRR